MTVENRKGARVVSTLLAMALAASFVAAAGHHHALQRAHQGLTVGDEPGRAGSGLQCHACILNHTPVTEAAPSAPVAAPETTQFAGSLLEARLARPALPAAGGSRAPPTAV